MIIGGSVHFENRDGFYTHIEIPNRGKVGHDKVLIADDQALIRESKSSCQPTQILRWSGQLRRQGSAEKLHRVRPDVT